MLNKYNNLKYQKEFYTSFNNQLDVGLKQGLNLYDPIIDKTLYKNTDDIDKQMQDIRNTNQKQIKIYQIRLIVYLVLLYLVMLVVML